MFFDCLDRVLTICRLCSLYGNSYLGKNLVGLHILLLWMLWVLEKDRVEKQPLFFAVRHLANQLALLLPGLKSRFCKLSILTWLNVRHIYLNRNHYCRLLYLFDFYTWQILCKETTWTKSSSRDWSWVFDRPPTWQIMTESREFRWVSFKFCTLFIVWRTMIGPTPKQEE